MGLNPDGGIDAEWMLILEGRMVAGVLKNVWRKAMTDKNGYV